MAEKQKKLTAKEELFKSVYCVNGFNGTQAAIEAGYGKKCAKETACKLLTKVNIRDAVREHLDSVIGQYKDTLHYKIINTYQKRAFYDPSKYITKDGALKMSLEDMGEMSVIIDGIETTINTKGYSSTKVKLANREKSLEQLTKYMQLIVDKVDVKVDVVTIGEPLKPG
jgi:phage terminase small subunit